MPVADVPARPKCRDDAAVGSYASRTVDDAKAEDRTLVANGYAPVVEHNAVPVRGEDWNKGPVLLEMIEDDRESSGSLGTALRTDRTTGIDYDIDDPILLEEMAGAAIDVLGPNPLGRRIGTKGFGTFYRTEAAFKSIKVSIEKDGQSKGAIEILGEGRKLTIFGPHRNAPGVHYQWLGPSPLEVKRDDLPSLEHEQAIALAHEYKNRAEARGCSAKITGLPRDPAEFERYAPAAIDDGFDADAYIEEGIDRGLGYWANLPRRKDRNEKTLVGAYLMHEFGIKTPERARELLLKWSNMGDGPDQKLDECVNRAYHPDRAHLFNTKRPAPRSASAMFGRIDEIVAGYVRAGVDQQGSTSAIPPGNDNEDDEGFPIYLSHQFKGRRQPRWLIEEVIRDRSTTMIYGKSEVFKTFLLLDLLSSVATGLPAFGHVEVNQTGDTLLCLAEDPDDAMLGRFPAWCRARGIVDPFGEPLILPSGRRAPGRFGIIPAVPLVADPTQVERLIRQIHKQGLDPRMIGIDTTAKAMLGLNQNDAKDAGLFVNGVMNRLRREFNCAVVATHHPKLDSDEMRGSGAFTNDTDAGILVRKKGRKSLDVTVEFARMKGAPPPPNIDLLGQLHPSDVVDKRGQIVKYPVFSMAPASTGTVNREDFEEGELRKNVLRVLREKTKTAEDTINGTTLAMHIWPKEKDEDQKEYQDWIHLRVQQMKRESRVKGEDKAKKDGELHDLIKRVGTGGITKRPMQPARWYLPDYLREPAD